MSFNGEMIELLNEMLAQLKAQARADRAPKPKPKPGSQEWYAALPAPKRDPEAIDMNELRRSVPKPKPPRRPSWG